MVIMAYQAGRVYSIDTLDKRKISVWDRMELDSVKFYHATQSAVQFKIYKLIISEICHLIVSDHSSLQIKL